MSAYHDGSALVRKIKDRRQKKRDRLLQASLDPAEEEDTEELEYSLTTGETLVKRRYDSEFRKFGIRFAEGDSKHTGTSHAMRPDAADHGYPTQLSPLPSLKTFSYTSKAR